MIDRKERLSNEEIVKKAKLYLDYKIHTHIVEKDSSGKVRNYNGFIVRIHEDIIVFQDRFITTPFPIPIDFIADIEVSDIKIEGEGDGTGAK